MTPDVLQPGEADAFERELNARAAFELMLGAALKAALLSGAASLIVGLVAAVADGFLVSSLGSVAIDAAGLACVVFFGGFIGAIVAGVPLFLFLERARIRRPTPYVVAAFLVNVAIYVVLTGGLPDLGAPAGLLYLLPGVAAALIFLRDIRPMWRMPPLAASGNVVRLH